MCACVCFVSCRCYYHYTVRGFLAFKARMPPSPPPSLRQRLVVIFWKYLHNPTSMLVCLHCHETGCVRCFECRRGAFLERARAKSAARVIQWHLRSVVWKHTIRPVKAAAAAAAVVAHPDRRQPVSTCANKSPSSATTARRQRDNKQKPRRGRAQKRAPVLDRLYSGCRTPNWKRCRAAGVHYWFVFHRASALLFVCLRGRSGGRPAWRVSVNCTCRHLRSGHHQFAGARSESPAKWRHWPRFRCFL